MALLFFVLHRLPKFAQPLIHNKHTLVDTRAMKTRRTETLQAVVYYVPAVLRGPATTTKACRTTTTIEILTTYPTCDVRSPGGFLQFYAFCTVISLACEALYETLTFLPGVKGKVFPHLAIYFSSLNLLNYTDYRLEIKFKSSAALVRVY